MNEGKPNLFSYASKELSQDAMICWLLKWADSSYREKDPAIPQLGREFVRALLAKHNQQADVNKVEVWQQWHRIDVLAQINDDHVLLIEDKTDTSDHSDQLDRYCKQVEEDPKFEGAKIHPIYFKTGNYPDGERVRIERKTNYKFFDRRDFLKVLGTYQGQNAILTDFRDYLQHLEDRTNSYRKWTVQDKRKQREAWQGFFKDIEEKIHSYGWGYVPNASGGFEGFWWGFRPIPDYAGAKAYLQLEASPGAPSRQHLCFKVDAGKDSPEVGKDLRQERRKGLREHWYKAIKNAGGDRVRKPRRWGLGQTMTVAIWGTDPDHPGWLIFGADGKLDIEQTLSCLREAEDVLKEAVNAS